MNALTVKIAASLVVLFGLGAATGVVAARKLASRPASAPARAPFEERWSKARFEQYRARLNLSPQQVAAIAPHFRRFGEQMRQLRDDVRERFTDSLRELNESVARELTPGQRKQLWSMLQERRQQRDNSSANQ